MFKKQMYREVKVNALKSMVVNVYKNKKLLQLEYKLFLEFQNYLDRNHFVIIS